MANVGLDYITSKRSPYYIISPQKYGKRLKDDPTVLHEDGRHRLHNVFIAFQGLIHDLWDEDRFSFFFFLTHLNGLTRAGQLRKSTI